MAVSSQQTPKTRSSDAQSNLEYQSYSVIGDTEKAWSRLIDLKVFRTTSWILELLDKTPSSDHKYDTRGRTFTEANSLKEYLDDTPMKGGTRYM